MMPNIVNRFCLKGLQLLYDRDSWRLLRRCRLCNVTFLGDCNICECCVAEFPPLPLLCSVCAEALKPGVTSCGACENEPPSFSATHAVWAWAPPVSELIKQFKFNADRSAGLDLARAMVKRIQAKAIAFELMPDGVLAMPLHATRLKERGYNQSAILAAALSREMKLPLLTAVTRVRATPAQSGLSRSQRQRNLQNAFQVTADVAGRHLMIVDDVITTGSSAEELAATLLQAGAGSVQVLVLCKVL